VAVAPPEVQESLAERYSRLARETAGRRSVDLGLRTFDVLLSALFLLVSLPLTVATSASAWVAGAASSRC
jgi:hypothetical protein